jgi:hypothetical protein
MSIYENPHKIMDTKVSNVFQLLNGTYFYIDEYNMIGHFNMPSGFYPVDSLENHVYFESYGMECGVYSLEDDSWHEFKKCGFNPLITNFLDLDFKEIDERKYQATYYCILSGKKLLEINHGSIVSWVGNILFVHECGIALSKCYMLTREAIKPESLNECIVCKKQISQSAQGRHVLLPCGHSEYCDDCIKNTKICDICGVGVSDFLKIQ